MVDPSPLLDQLARARGRTLDLISLVGEPDLNRSLNPEFSPLRWHLGHVAAFEAFWVLVRAAGRPFPWPEYERLFDPRRNPKADRVNLPRYSELIAFADRVRSEVLEVLLRSHPDQDSPLLRDGYVGWLVHEHERQHQETMTFLLQMVPPGRKRRPSGWKPDGPGTEPPAEMISIPGGTFLMGATGPGFAYDNERDPHEVHLDGFRIARTPVTELAFLRFIEDGGYRDPRLWSEAGWRWRVDQEVNAPRDWTGGSFGGWTIRGQFSERPPLPGYPVVGVSHFEADAYARWAGGRLPTEAEWERASAWDASVGRSSRFPWGDTLPTPEVANTDGLAWGVRPLTAAGRSPSGCDDMVGQVWEWTSTPFSPYPGFGPFPYSGYSQDWFDGRHFVLRGGSWATAGPLCRCSFRNWYEPHARELYSGFRIASDRIPERY